MPIVPLQLLSLNESATIVDIDGDPAVVARLREMGLNNGNEVRMVQCGEPCMIAVGSQRLSFRCEELAVIFVEN